MHQTFTLKKILSKSMNFHEEYGQDEKRRAAKKLLFAALLNQDYFNYLVISKIILIEIN